MKKTGLLILLLFVFPALVCGVADSSKGALWAVSDGKGTVSLFWIPKDLAWPAGGFRLEKTEGKQTVILAEKIDAGQDAAAMAGLLPADREAIEKFRSDIRSGAIPKGEEEIAVTMVGLSAAFRPEFGRALGLRYTDTDPGTGIRTYRLSALNAKGKVQSVLTSNSVDPKKAAPLPDPPAMLAAEPSEAGVDFSWGESAPKI